MGGRGGGGGKKPLYAPSSLIKIGLLTLEIYFFERLDRQWTTTKIDVRPLP